MLSFQIIFALLVLFFWGISRYTHWFRLNRFLLLGLVAAAILIPLLPQPWSAPAGWESPVIWAPVQFSGTAEFPTDGTGAREVVASDTPLAPSFFPIALIGVWIYGVGVLFFLGRYLFRLHRLSRFLRSSAKEKQADYTLVVPRKETPPFSFFRYIILPQHLEEPSLQRQILQHELVHVRQWHSIDIMLAEVVLIAAWLNPAAWLYRRLVRNNLEYLVDQELIRKGMPRKSYQYSLLRLSVAPAGLSLVNHYNSSFIKKRIQKMNSKQSFRQTFFSYFSLLLLILATAQVFGQVKVYQRTQAPAKDQLQEGDLVVLISRDATSEDLGALSDALLDREVKMEVSNLGFGKDGRIESINVALQTGKSSGSVGYDGDRKSFAGTDLLLYMIVGKDRGRISFSFFNNEDYAELMQDWSAIEVLTAGIQPTKAAFQAMKARIEAETKKLEEIIANRKAENKDTPNSLSVTFPECDNPQTLVGIGKYIRKQEGKYRIDARYFIDGIPRKDVNIADLDCSTIKSIKIVEFDTKKDEQGRETAESIEVRIERKTN